MLSKLSGDSAEKKWNSLLWEEFCIFIPALILHEAFLEKVFHETFKKRKDYEVKKIIFAQDRPFSTCYCGAKN